VKINDASAKVFKVMHACVLIAALTGYLWAADPVVSNISAVQRAGTKLVDIADDPSASNENRVTLHERIVIDLIGSK
jgi:hypothetical protein